jgi:hypothetical protein
MYKMGYDPPSKAPILGGVDEIGLIIGDDGCLG